MKVNEIPFRTKGKKMGFLETVADRMRRPIDDFKEEALGIVKNFYKKYAKLPIGPVLQRIMNELEIVITRAGYFLGSLSWSTQRDGVIGSIAYFITPEELFAVATYSKVSPFSYGHEYEMVMQETTTGFRMRGDPIETENSITQEETGNLLRKHITQVGKLEQWQDAVIAVVSGKSIYQATMLGSWKKEDKRIYGRVGRYLLYQEESPDSDQLDDDHQGLEVDLQIPTAVIEDQEEEVPLSMNTLCFEFRGTGDDSEIAQIGFGSQNYSQGQQIMTPFIEEDLPAIKEMVQEGKLEEAEERISTALKSTRFFVVGNVRRISTDSDDQGRRRTFRNISCSLLQQDLEWEPPLKEEGEDEDEPVITGETLPEESLEIDEEGWDVLHEDESEEKPEEEDEWESEDEGTTEVSEGEVEPSMDEEVSEGEVEFEPEEDEEESEEIESEVEDESEEVEKSEPEDQVKEILNILGLRPQSDINTVAKMMKVKTKTIKGAYEKAKTMLSDVSEEDVEDEEEWEEIKKRTIKILTKAKESKKTVSIANLSQHFKINRAKMTEIIDQLQMDNKVREVKEGRFTLL